MATTAARFLPALRLIAEAGIIPAHLMRRPPDRAFEQVSNLVPQDPVGRQPDHDPYPRLRETRRSPCWHRPRRRGNPGASPYPDVVGERLADHPRISRLLRWQSPISCKAWGLRHRTKVEFVPVAYHLSGDLASLGQTRAAAGPCARQRASHRPSRSGQARHPAHDMPVIRHRR